MRGDHIREVKDGGNRHQCHQDSDRFGDLAHSFLRLSISHEVAAWHRETSKAASHAPYYIGWEIILVLICRVLVWKVVL